MRKLVLGLALAGCLVLSAGASAEAGKPDPWACHQRAPDGQCIIPVSVAGGFPGIDQQIIREVLANFSESPNVELVVGKPADITMALSNDGFFTDLRTRKVTIDRKWVGGVWDGIRQVYCHELMHAVAGEGDGAVRLQPSCFNGTSPFLGVEDFQVIALAYPLGG